ncbi:MAG: glycosyltransferase family 39 protein [Thermodesulfobacteriota bacterium]
MAQANGSGSTFRLLGFVLLVALLVRVALPVYVGLVTGDTQAFFEVYTHEYREPARNLLSSGSYTSSGKPEIYRPPGYPLLLLPGLLFKHEAIVTIVLQMILSLLTVWLVFRLSLLIFENVAAALLAALCYALEPLSIVFCSLLMPETLMTCLLTAFLLYFSKYVKEGTARDLTSSAVLLSFSAYVAAYLYFLPLLVVITLAGWRICGKRLAKPSPLWGGLSSLPAMAGRNACPTEGAVRGADQRRLHRPHVQFPPLAHIAVFLVICAVLLGAWQVRNYATAGYWGFSGIFDRSMYYAQAASLLAEQQGKPEFQSAWDELDGQLAAHIGRDANLSDELRYMRGAGLKSVLRAPLQYLQIHVKGIGKTLAGLEAHTFLRLLNPIRGKPEGWDSLTHGKGLMRGLIEDRSGASVAVFVVITLLAGVVAVLYLFSTFAFISRTIPWTMAVITLLTGAAYILIVTGGPHGYSRYRHGIMPIICIFAGYGLAMLWRRYGSRSFKQNAGP